MCGIVGIISNQPVAPLLLEGLKRLEYRGYDSAGIATLLNSSIERRRAEGKLVNLQGRLVEDPVEGSIGIGHTRWATHGVPSETNAHPHATARAAVVHNGIIENFQELREDLSGDGYNFETDTDTEAVVHLIDRFLSDGLSPQDAVAAALPKLEGAFALVMIFAGEHDLMIGARRGSPLAIGYGEGEMYFGSDALALAPLTQKICYLEEGDWAVVTSSGAEVMNEYDLGPNGAQILAADLVAAQALDVAEELHALSGELIIVDTPGQVELFAFREASSHLIEVLGQEQAAIIYLFDPMLSRSPSGFVSQMLLSSIVEFRLGLPTKNFLSKSDLLEEEDLEKILEWSERLEILEMALYDEAGGQRTEFAINQLRMMQQFSQTPGLTPLSSETEDGMADVLTFAQALFGGMSDARDGFAADIEHEKN